MGCILAPAGGGQPFDPKQYDRTASSGLTESKDYDRYCDGIIGGREQDVLAHQPIALRDVLQGPTLQQGRHLGLPFVLQGVEKILKCHQIFFERKMHVEFGAAKLLREATNLHCKNALEKKRAQKIIRLSCR